VPTQNTQDGESRLQKLVTIDDRISPFFRAEILAPLDQNQGICVNRRFSGRLCQSSYRIGIGYSGFREVLELVDSSAGASANQTGNKKCECQESNPSVNNFHSLLLMVVKLVPCQIALLFESHLSPGPSLTRSSWDRTAFTTVL
jgi:hypothetical protein